MSFLALKKLTKKNRRLFWEVNPKKLENLSKEAVVERILNYGNEESVKSLFKTLGIKETAAIFFKQIKKPRNNYFLQTVNFFKLYFKKNA